MASTDYDDALVDRAQGVLYGQFIGDSLGSLVEWRSPHEIAEVYPDGVRELVDGGPYGLLAGQPTDDSEMALALARSLVTLGSFDIGDIRGAYERWMRSEPFSVGQTCKAALTGGYLSPDSQANGALMRISPLAVFGAGRPAEADGAIAEAAMEDAQITHVNPLCTAVNATYTLTLARIVREGLGRDDAVDTLHTVACEYGSPEVEELVSRGLEAPPEDYVQQMGWVTIAFTNAVYELAHGDSFEESLVRTIGHGGDTDTNAAICGALVGGLYGAEAIPQRWRDTIDNCKAYPGTLRPRPEEYWPADAAKLARNLVTVQ
ncbi:MAG: ADP-ribosylglycohydrolase family protein [Corynebacterium glucuronolyticum]|nr:ADP-ribosylglycohydrolase family protein [Corynebacterium glucuronolyticum]MDD7587498.1 ADP-ribosylglycohydrolase family protein [Mycobacteriaceae bacterium]MDY5833811.1 ADP-ribosylglycohydrolase family protein [Corynebacterium glucuronolyticum]